MTTTTYPIHEGRQFFINPQGAAFKNQKQEPIDPSLLADAEEEEMLELWAMDRGNQGA